MTIASEIERIRNGVSAVYTKLEEKGATLPEEQSLENICDTVDTVPAGGAEPSYLKDFNTMAAIIEADEAALSTSTISKSEMEEQGYVTNAAGYRNRIIGFVYGDKVESIYLSDNTSVVYGFKIPSSATYEHLTGVSRYKVTFGSEKWIIVRGGNSAYFRTLSSFSKATSESGSEYYKIAIPTACYNYSGSSNSTISNLLGSYADKNTSELKYLKFGPHVTNITVPTSSDMTYWSFLFRLDNLGEIVKQFSGYDSTSETLTLTGDVAKNLCGLASSYAGQCNVLGCMKNGTNIVFDLSGVTGTGTATLFPYMSSYPYVFPQVEDLKIKLPSTYSTVDLTYQKYNAKVGLRLTPESLAFIANNAPNVTSATLNIGENNLNYLTFTTAGQALLATLNSKGWTVS